MYVDPIVVLKQVPDMFGLASKMIRAIGRRRNRQTLERAIIALRKIHFAKEGYLSLLEKAKRGPLQSAEVEHISDTLRENYADIDEAVSIVAEYAESTDHDWDTMENAKTIVAGKQALLDFVHHFANSPDPPEREEVELVLNSISAFNRRVQKLHDRVVAELRLLSERS